MAGNIILVDTSLLIDHFRKSDKSKSKLVSLHDQGFTFCIAVITEYEIYAGAPDGQIAYWRQFLKDIVVLNFDSDAVNKAVEINNLLKAKSKQIAVADLFIAAIALSNNLPLATLNKKHFDRIDGLATVD